MNDWDSLEEELDSMPPNAIRNLLVSDAHFEAPVDHLYPIVYRWRPHVLLPPCHYGDFTRGLFFLLPNPPPVTNSDDDFDDIPGLEVPGTDSDSEDHWPPAWFYHNIRPAGCVVGG